MNEEPDYKRISLDLLMLCSAAEDYASNSCYYKDVDELAKEMGVRLEYDNKEYTFKIIPDK